MRISKGTTDKRRMRTRRGQSTVELALVLPLIIILLSIVIEAGLALNAWIRVNTAARDATRFALDSGRPNDIASLVLNKMEGMDTSRIDVYIISGTTDSTGNISDSNWAAWTNHRWGARTGGPNVRKATIVSKLTVAGNPTANRNLPFVVVEVDFQYSPLLATLLARGTYLPMTSYAIMQLN
jgi:Flp pilus assembly protein TadG